ncbi:hypothetical protein DY000_02055360 [Brassica cretica]|uniref:Secreted protein n=1 Tax=Brassica cretica TaxID=69181 RepID=A0ABQ7ALD0_BRACR|nr:hypothetical protein DY000_02055360 [Brassica cretica]
MSQRQQQALSSLWEMLLMKPLVVAYSVLLADWGTRASWTSDARCSDANGNLRTSRIRNALGLELIRWMQVGTRAGADYGSSGLGLKSSARLGFKGFLICSGSLETRVDNVLKQTV